MLNEADAILRAEVYHSLGIALTYLRDDEDLEKAKIEASLKGADPERVGGGT